VLRRSSGSEEAPRMLGAFNEETPDWLSFFMFTYFTDRDGKMQLESLAQSGFDPLSRTCRFMLTEEAHHMFVGESGVGRTIQATVEAMAGAGISDPFDINRIRELVTRLMPVLKGVLWSTRLTMITSLAVTRIRCAMLRTGQLSKKKFLR